jgi:hypothetical protein
MGKAADLPVRPRRGIEIEMSERVSVACSRRDVKCLEEMLTDEMRGIATASPTPIFTLGSRKYTGRSCAWQSVKCSRLTFPKRGRS